MNGSLGNRLFSEGLTHFWLDWAAPHFLVHLKWELSNRNVIHWDSYMRARVLLILSSQDELNSFGVA